MSRELTRFAVATDDGERIAAHTGRCRGFSVFDSEEGAARPVEFRANSFTAHAQGECDGGKHGHGQGHGHAHSHGPLVDALADCRYLVARGMGPRLIADLAARGIEAYFCRTEEVEEAARTFALGELPRVAKSGCHHRH